MANRIARIIQWLCAGLVFAVSVAHAEPKKELWVYTSIYKEFAAPIAKAFEEKYPEYSVQVFQSGSEKIQAKVEAELLAKKPQADLILTSDPFWAQDLEKRNLIANRSGHPDTNYFSLMVMIAHKNFAKEKRPVSFQDLAKPEFDQIVQAGSPLESGTTFTTVASLQKKYGWDFFKKLAHNHLASSGGNSTVVQKVESGEKKIGIVLLENALAAQKRGSPIDIIYPSDGAVPIPSVQVILKGTSNPEGAQKFAEFILSLEGQKLLRNGFMHSVRKDVDPPEGAPALGKLTKSSTAWTPELIREVSSQAKDIKRQFAAIVLE